MSDFKPEVVSQLDDLIKRKGKPNQEPSTDKDKPASVTQTSKEGVNIHAQGDVHYHAAPLMEGHTRADRRTKAAKKDRKKAKPKPHYVDQRYLEKIKRTDTDLLRRETDFMALETKARNKYMWLVVMMLVLFCLLTLISIVIFTHV